MSKRVKNEIKVFLQKSFSPFSRNSTISEKDYSYLLLKSSQANTYVETLGNKADSLHRRIQLSYFEDMRDAYSSIIKSLCKFKRFDNVDLAIDITGDDFYGKTTNFYIHSVKPVNGVVGQFKFIVLSLANQNPEKKISVLALPLHIGEEKGEAIRFMLNFAKKLFKHIRVVLFDRGFYSGEVIEVVQNLKLNYLIFTPKTKAIARYINETKSFSSRELEHTIKWNAHKTLNKTPVRLFLIKDFNDKGKLYDWCFATNLQLDKAENYIFLYKRRWQIETNFRVANEAQIKSKSINYFVRYFYFLMKLLLHALWLIFEKTSHVFKAFLISLYENMFFEFLGIEHSSP